VFVVVVRSAVTNVVQALPYKLASTFIHTYNSSPSQMFDTSIVVACR